MSGWETPSASGTARPPAPPPYDWHLPRRRATPQRWSAGRKALLGTLVRWMVVAAFPERPVVMLLAQVLHLFGFGLFHTATVLLAPKLMPPGSEARAQSLISSVGWGAGGIAGSLASGWLWDAVGPRSAYVASAAVVAVAVAVTALGLRDLEHGPARAPA